MCTSCSTLPDPNRVDAFGNQLIQILDHGGAALMISLGHESGLFDAMATMPPATSFEIADHADLNERYVRECLGALTTARIVEYDVSARTYHLPPAHAALLTRAAAPNNIASTMASLPMLGSVEERILECFRRGGGVPYEA